MKNCPICQKIVGANYPSNCQCEKERNYCEYCQTDPADVTSSNSLISDGRFKGATFSGSAFSKNKLLTQIVAEKQNCSCKKDTGEIVKEEVEKIQTDRETQITHSLSLISGGDFEE